MENLFTPDCIRTYMSRIVKPRLIRDKKGNLVPINKTFKIGDVFGDLVIISEEINQFRKDGRPDLVYKCKCKCGLEVTYGKYRIKSGEVKSCGRIVKSTSAYLYADRKRRCRNCATEEMWKRLGKKTPVQKLYREYKNGALKRGLEFNLTPEEFSSIVHKNCHYCDDPPKLTTHAKQIDFLCGVDRVDNKRGYTIDNSVPCCWICNQLKSDIELAVFKEKVIKIYNHYIK